MEKKKCSNGEFFKPNNIYLSDEEKQKIIIKKKLGCLGGRKMKYVLSGCCLKNIFVLIEKCFYFNRRKGFKFFYNLPPFINVLLKIVFFPFTIIISIFLTFLLLIFPGLILVPSITNVMQLYIHSDISLLLYIISFGINPYLLLLLIIF